MRETVELVDRAELPEQREPEAGPQPKLAAIVSAVAVDEHIALTVRVREDDGSDREYMGSVLVGVLARLSPEEQRRALVEAVRVERDRVRRVESIDLSGLSGDVELW